MLVYCSLKYFPVSLFKWSIYASFLETFISLISPRRLSRTPKWIVPFVREFIQAAANLETSLLNFIMISSSSAFSVLVSNSNSCAGSMRLNGPVSRTLRILYCVYSVPSLKLSKGHGIHIFPVGCWLFDSGFPDTFSLSADFIAFFVFYGLCLRILQYTEIKWPIFLLALFLCNFFILSFSISIHCLLVLQPGMNLKLECHGVSGNILFEEQAHEVCPFPQNLL